MLGCLCVESRLCKSIVTGVEKSEPSEVPYPLNGDITDLTFYPVPKNQISIHAKIEPANTIIDGKTNRILKMSEKYF